MDMRNMDMRTATGANGATGATGANEASGVNLGDITVNLAQGSVYQLAPGTRLQNGRYVVESVIGKGGMGHVYLVRDTHFTGARPLVRALKEMIPRFADMNDLQANIVNFTREANMLAELRHPGIPTVYDSFTEFHRAYLILDYIEGADLEQVLRTTPGMLSQETVARWMLQLCEIVHYLHTHHPPIIFRDLKPSNVILMPDQRIILIDFGIAKLFQGDDHQTNVGTNGYAAPEQYERRAEMRSDIYSLGAMMHHLLTKTDPRFQAPFSFHERPIRSLNPTVSPAMEAVVNRCLEREREQRYQSVYELSLALEDALGLTPATDDGRSAAVAGVAGMRGATGRMSPPLGGPTPRVRWRFRTEEEVRSTPSATNDLLLVGSYDNNLYALELQTGKWRWQFATEGGICGAPAVWKNSVFVGSEDFNLYALSGGDGKPLWQYRTWNHVRSSPRVYDDRLYVGSDDGHLHAVDPRTGRLLWRYRTFREVQSSAAYAGGVLFFGSNDEYLYAVDAVTGERKWSYRSQSAIISSPTVVGNYVYFGSKDFSVYCLEAKSGWLAWCERTDKFVISSPCVAGDRLYIGSTDGYLYCMNRKTGATIWKFNAGNQVSSSPVVVDGAVYFGGVDGGVYCLDANEGKLRWRFQTGDRVPGSPLVRDGVVYIGSTDGWVYALDAAL